MPLKRQFPDNQLDSIIDYQHSIGLKANLVIGYIGLKWVLYIYENRISVRLFRCS